jgi:hypothetical protein
MALCIMQDPQCRSRVGAVSKTTAAGRVHTVTAGQGGTKREWCPLGYPEQTSYMAGVWGLNAGISNPDKLSSRGQGDGFKLK